MQTKLLSVVQYQNSRIARYVRRNLFTLFCAIVFIIGLVLFGNQFVMTVQKSIQQGIPFQELMPLVGIKMIRDASLILSLSLFLAIIITISHLYKNSEAVVMNSLGLSDKHFIAFIQPLVLLAFVIVFFLAIYAVPWAKHQKNIMEEEVKNASEFSFISEGEFEIFREGDIVFYASESQIPDSTGEQSMEEIFIYMYKQGKPVIVLASEAKKYTDPISKSSYLSLKDGTQYKGFPGNENRMIANFDSYNLEIISGEFQKSLDVYTKIESKNTLDLFKEEGRYASAEFQWRLSQPIALLILSVLGVFLGKASPRRGKGINLLVGVIVFMLYYNVLLIAKSAIELGQINPIIGLWGVHLFMVVLILLLYRFRHGRLASYLDKISHLQLKEERHA